MRVKGEAKVPRRCMACWKVFSVLSTSLRRMPLRPNGIHADTLHIDTTHIHLYMVIYEYMAARLAVWLAAWLAAWLPACSTWLHGWLHGCRVDCNSGKAPPGAAVRRAPGLHMR